MLRLIYPRSTVSIVFWIFPVTLHVLNPSSSATLILSCTVLCTQLSPLLRSCAAYPPGQFSTPAGLHRPYLCSLSCLPRPAPQVLVGPCSPAPGARFWHLFPRRFVPLLLPSMWWRPCQPLWFLPSRFRHYSTIPWTTSPTCRPWPAARSLPVPREVKPPTLVYIFRVV